MFLFLDYSRFGFELGFDHNQTSQHDYFAKGLWPFF
jgi:hypothetical protein